MKKVLLILSLAFCTIAAQAATLNSNYVASDGKVFQTANILAVEQGTGTILITQATGTVQPFADTTGSIYTKVVSAYGFSHRFVKVSATSTKFINVALATEVSCMSNQSAIGFPAAQPIWLQDACVFQNAVKALSN